MGKSATFPFQTDLMIEMLRNAMASHHCHHLNFNASTSKGTLNTGGTLNTVLLKTSSTYLSNMMNRRYQRNSESNRIHLTDNGNAETNCVFYFQRRVLLQQLQSLCCSNKNWLIFKATSAFIKFSNRNEGTPVTLMLKRLIMSHSAICDCLFESALVREGIQVAGTRR